MLIAEYQSNQGEHSILQAIGLLERLLKVADAQKREGSVLEILLVQALAHQAQGNLTLALASLERALVLAHPEGYVRIFVDEGDAMRLLILDFRSRIEKQSSSQDHPLLGYVEKLIFAFARPVEKQSTISNVKSGMIETDADRLGLQDQRRRLEGLLATFLDTTELPLPAAMPDEDLVHALAQYLALEPVERQALLEADGPLARSASLAELIEMKLLLQSSPASRGDCTDSTTGCWLVWLTLRLAPVSWSAAGRWP